MHPRDFYKAAAAIILDTHRGIQIKVAACQMALHLVPHGVAAQVRGADYVIYAPHAPDALEDAYNVQRDPFFDLALCGHTHGGQVTLLGFAPYTASRRGLRYGNHYRSGEIEEHGVTVLVSNGVGTTWLPVRLGARAQYHLITLSRARAQ